MKIEEIQKEPLVAEWLLNIKTDSTMHNYSLGLMRYCNFLSKSPTQLIEEAEDEEKERMRRRHIKNYLISFRAFLKEENLSPLTVRGYIVGVKAFYTFFEIELPHLQREAARVQQENNRVPTKQDLQDVLKVSSPLEKAVVLVGVSSGLAANEIINLKVLDFKNGYDEKTGITTFILRRLKTSIDFVTFLSPEASNAVIDYLKYRNRTSNNERIEKQLRKQRVYDDSNYLFCRRKVSATFLNNFDERERVFNRFGFIQLFKDLAGKASKKTQKGDYGLIRSHTMRKYFNSAMLNAGCDFFHVEEFMGHSLPATQNHYYQADIEGLKEYYKKFVPYLIIQKELDISESEAYKDIKNENDILRAETAKNIVEREEIQRLQQELTEVQNQYTIFENAIKVIAFLDPKTAGDAIIEMFNEADEMQEGERGKEIVSKKRRVEKTKSI